MFNLWHHRNSGLDSHGDVFPLFELFRVSTWLFYIGTIWWYCPFYN